MEKMGAYTLCFSFPLNRETCGLYSDDEDLKLKNIQQTLNAIGIILSSHGFCTMSRLMDYFELRPTRRCPSLVFTSLENFELSYDEIHQTDVMTVWVSNDLKLRPLLRYEPEQELVMAESDKIPTLFCDISHAARKEDAEECQTGPKETCDSGENETTL